MSILKGIMHHWNKTKNDYDVIHPETDYKKITDWNEGIVATLASTALGNLVSTMTSDSLLAKMIQLVLTATGVKYSTGQNGYLCFGSLGGGIIIQWGKTANSVVVWPISFANTDYIATALKHLDHGGGIPNIIGLDKNKITIEFEAMNYDNGIAIQKTYISNGVHVIAVGK